MRDRAYLSGRAILQINSSARLRSHECASKYPIPCISLEWIPTSVFSFPFFSTDGDLEFIISMLKFMDPSTGDDGFAPRSICEADPLWMSNLFVDLARASYPTTPRLLRTACATQHLLVKVNLFLGWYIILGGNIEEETFWAVDKSYVVPSLSFPSIH